MNRFLSQEDAAVLSRLAEGLFRTGRQLHVAEQLLVLLEQCILLPETADNEHIASLNTRVFFAGLNDAEPESVDLVCPADGNLQLAGRSILSQLALTLLGLPVGSAVPFVSAAGVETIRVLQVLPLGQAHAPAASPQASRLAGVAK